MKNKLAIIGASGHGKVCADVAYHMGKWIDIVFLDSKKVKSLVLNFKVIDSSDNWNQYIDEYDLFIAIGDNKTRERIFHEISNSNASVATLIHPSAVIGLEVEIGVGSIIAAGVVINPATSIGNGVIINTGSTVDHDNEIKDFVHISPGAHLAGTVSVETRSWIGVGGIIKNNVSIGTDVVVGAGGVVVKDIEEAGTYVGVPVRRM